ncbi:MAG: tkt, partial [Alphaproteobacteria bacterium]|nr:tkt [Alphaproteobacteria bacterium]
APAKGVDLTVVYGVNHDKLEAGTTLGWERYTGLEGVRIGLDRFGASAPAEDLFKRFGFTAEAVVPQIKAALNKMGDQ